jgi:hypothetical protein
MRRTFNSRRIYQNPRCRFRRAPQYSSRYWSPQTSLERQRSLTTSHPGQGGEGGELRKYIGANSYARYASIRSLLCNIFFFLRCGGL